MRHKRLSLLVPSRTPMRERIAGGKTLLFRAYVDPSPSAAADLFTRLSIFYSPPTPVSIGDKAYFDPKHGLHVLKGKVRYFIAMDDSTAASEKQLAELGRQVAGRL